jgi:acyl-CoA thioester hydrolase
MISTTTEIKAQFYDLDPMNIVWHGNYARFLEQARCDLLDFIGFNYVQMMATDHAWPIVDMRTKYVRPIRFGQRISVTATLVEWENRLRIDYRIVDTVTGEVLTKAQTTQMAVHIRTGETAFESPAPLLEAVRKASA